LDDGVRNILAWRFNWPKPNIFAKAASEKYQRLQQMMCLFRIPQSAIRIFIGVYPESLVAHPKLKRNKIFNLLFLA